MTVANTFDRLEARQSRATDQHFGEALTILPQKEGINSRGGPDPDRPAISVRGVFMHKAKQSGPKHHAVKVDDMESTASFDLRNLAYPVVQGDLIQRPKTSETYRIESIKPDGTGRVTYCLQRVSQTQH